MRFLTALKVLKWVALLGLMSPHAAMGEDMSLLKVHGPWIDSRPFLKDTTKPAEAELEIPLVENLHNALITGMNNIEHHHTVLLLQQNTGTLDPKHGEGYLLSHKSLRPADANSTHATRWSLFRNAKTYSGKEIKVDVVPESIKKGFRFDQSAPKEAPRAKVVNGTPVKYGLILKNIEPSDDQSLRIAALSSESDLTHFLNAPKADVEYEIGPIALTPAPQGYNFNPAAAAPAAAPEFNWRDYVPDRRFRGKFSPRGMPTAAKPLPDQTLTLEQVQGYYSAEIQFVNGFAKESMMHRFNIPIYGDLRIYEEFDENWKPVKLVVSNAFGDGFYSNLEHYFLEKRYRAGFFYRAGHTNLEIYANLPDNALNQTFKKRQTWEFNILKAI